MPGPRRPGSSPPSRGTSMRGFFSSIERREPGARATRPGPAGLLPEGNTRTESPCFPGDVRAQSAISDPTLDLSATPTASVSDRPPRAVFLAAPPKAGGEVFKPRGGQPLQRCTVHVAGALDLNDAAPAAPRSLSARTAAPRLAPRKPPATATAPRTPAPAHSTQQHQRMAGVCKHPLTAQLPADARSVPPRSSDVS